MHSLPQAILLAVLLLTCGDCAGKFRSFQDPVYGEFGLVDEGNVPCMRMKFGVKMYNFNLNDTDIATELAEFTSSDVKLDGQCASTGAKHKTSYLQALWRVGERRKLLKFVFNSIVMKTTAHDVDELRWQLDRITYMEKYKNHSVRFETTNKSLIVSAPLHQKYVCRDRLNTTLSNPKYKDIVLEFLPEVDFQPINVKTGYGSNVYLCERTRRRTLSESFQSKMTIFSGVVLGISSVATLVGYSLRRQFLPSRQQFYANLS